MINKNDLISYIKSNRNDFNFYNSNRTELKFDNLTFRVFGDKLFFHIYCSLRGVGGGQETRTIDIDQYFIYVRLKKLKQIKKKLKKLEYDRNKI